MTVSCADAAPTVSWYAGKTAPPTLRTVTSRRRLLTAIGIALKKKQICGIIAPGGAGKTTLAAEWAQRASIPVAWYRLDALDGDLSYCVRGIATAVNRVAPELGDGALRALDGGATATMALDRLLAILENHPLAIVFDDLHQIAESPSTLNLLERFCRKRPATLSLIFLTRKLPIELTHSGYWCTITDLQFHPKEVQDFFAAHGLNPEYAAQLAQHSQGLAAGMLLRAQTKKQEALTPLSTPTLHVFEEAASVVNAPGAGELFRQYLESMLANLSPALRSFVLDTALLGTITAVEAEAILSRTDSATCYAALETLGFFIERIGGTYKYHDLLVVQLLQICQEEDPHHAQLVRRKGAAWWTTHGDIPRALLLFRHNEDWEELTTLLLHERHNLWRQGLWDTIVLAVEAIPTVYRTARLYALAGHVYLERGQVAKAEEYAEKGKQLAQTEEEWLHPEILAINVLKATGRVAEVVSRAKHARDIVVRQGDRALEAKFCEIEGIVRLRLGMSGGEDLMWSAISLYKCAQRPADEARVLGNLAARLVDIGYTMATTLYLAQAETLARGVGDTAQLGYISNVRALACGLDGDFKQARVHALEAQQIAQKLGSYYLECLATATLAEVAADAGAPDASHLAHEAIKVAQELGIVAEQNCAWRALITDQLQRSDPLHVQYLITAARPTATLPTDAALLDLLEATLILRLGGRRRAYVLLEALGPRLHALNLRHYTARAYLLLAEAALSCGVEERLVTAALNHLPRLLASGTRGFLYATVRWTPRVFTYYAALQKERRIVESGLTTITCDRLNELWAWRNSSPER